MEETEGKLSSFHLDDIKEASSKLEDYYQSQIVPVYNDLMVNSSEADVVDIRKEMDSGSRSLQHKIWTINDTVNNKKALLHAKMKSVDLTIVPDNTSAAVPSMTKPQNFHNKLEFSSFKRWARTGLSKL